MQIESLDVYFDAAVVFIGILNSWNAAFSVKSNIFIVPWFKLKLTSLMKY